MQTLISSQTQLYAARPYKTISHSKSEELAKRWSTTGATRRKIEILAMYTNGHFSGGQFTSPTKNCWVVVEQWVGCFLFRFNYFAASFLPWCENRTGDLYANIVRVSRARDLFKSRKLLAQGQRCYSTAKIATKADGWIWRKGLAWPLSITNTNWQHFNNSLGGTTTEARRLCQI